MRAAAPRVRRGLGAGRARAGRGQGDCKCRRSAAYVSSLLSSLLTAASPARRVARPAARLLTVAAAGKSEPAASSFDTAEVLATLTEKVGSGAGPQAHVAASGREAQQQPAAVEARRDDC